jgi:hypothetical protein
MDIEQDKDHEITKIKDICKNLNKEDQNEIFKRVENMSCNYEDKIKCDVIKTMNKLKIIIYDDVVIDNFYNNKNFDNLLSLLTKDKINPSVKDKEVIIKNGYIKNIINLLGFSLSKNISLKRDDYIKNVNEFFKSTFYKTLDYKQFNIMFDFKKDSKLNTKLCYFNKQINHILKDYDLEICTDRLNHNNKYNNYKLLYINNINEILLNFNTVIKPYEPTKFIYKEILKNNDFDISILE